MSGNVSPTPEWRLSFDRTAQIKAGLIAVAFVAAFWELLRFVPTPVLGKLPYAWRHEADWSHGWIIPLFSAYLVYVKWDQLRRVKVRFAWIGLPIMLIGLAAYVFALCGLQFGYVKPLSMMVCLLGVIVLLCGVPAMRYLWVPYMYLFFAIPLPKSIYFAVTNPLRRWAASIATTMLSLVPSLEIRQTGSVIDAVYQGQYHAIGVADACSGMRSTITLCAIGVAVAFIFDRPWWQRVILVAACLPIATFCNFIRVSITCVLYIFVDEEYATGTYHMMLGLIMMAIAFGMFSALGWVLSHLVVDESAEPDDAGEPVHGA
ncbi:MAG: exosortase/archaeosortase family protein [Phycisphaerae bacterium]|nr:exosortase/archaeosortase family protein [Phycisphaerae bacterium]